MRLRAIEESDLPQLRDWRNSDWLRPFVREHRLLNMVNQRDWLDHISGSREVEMFGIEAMFIANDVVRQWHLIGACGLCYIDWVNRTAEVSIYVAPGHQRQGIAQMALGLLRQKAFGEFNLHRLWAEIYSNNPASVGLFEKSGYSLEGRMHAHVFKQGRYYDSLIYGLLRREA